MINLEGLQVTIRKGLQVIKFNRPNKKNALTPQMYDAITELLNNAAKDDTVVMTALTGSGDFYSSGNDITAAISASANDTSRAVKDGNSRIRNFVAAFINYPKILIAVVNGPAIGISATTLGLCDIVYASDKAYFLTPFTKLGLVAEGCSSYTFPRIMGTSKANEMILFGHKMNAYEAKQCGFIADVFPHDIFDQEVWPKVEQFTLLPKQSMMASKRIIRARILVDLHKANDAECNELQERWQSEESLNAIMEFMSRRSKM